MIARAVPFAVVAILLGVFTAVLASRARTPYAGAQVTGGVVDFVASDGPTAAAGVQVGDAWDPSQITPSDTPRRQLASAGAVQFIAGLGWLVAGLVLLIRRDDPERRLVFAASVLFGGALLLQSPFALRDVLGPAPPAFIWLAVAGVPVLAAAGSTFFVPPRAVLATGIGFAVVTPLAGLLSPEWAVAVGLLGIIAVMRLQRSRCSDFTRHRQASWAMGGLTLAGLTQLAAAATETDAGVAAAAVGSLAVPLSFALAHFKVQLLQVERLLGSAVVDSALALPPLILAWRILDHEGLPARQRMVAAITVAGAGVWIAGRVREPLTNWLAKTLWPDRERARLAAESAIEAADDANTAFEACGERIATGFGFAHARLWRIVPGGAQPARGDTLTFPLTGHLVAVVEHFGAPAFVSDFDQARLTPGEREALREVELVVPCQDALTGALVGWLAVGPRADGKALDAARYRLLAELAPRLAHALAPLAQAADEHERAAAFARASRRARAAVAAALAAAADTRAENEALRGDLALLELPVDIQRFPAALWLDQTAALLQRVIGVGAMTTRIERVDSIHGDPDALRAALLLIADELRDALHEWSGERGAELSLAVEAGVVAITLTDSGPARRLGFDPVWAHPTGAYQRLDRLAARALARAHDGDLKLEAVPEGGMRARITLPLARLAG